MNDTLEVWKTIPNYPLYEVSNLGRVLSWNNSGGNDRSLKIKPKTPRILKESRSNKDYLRVALSGKTKKVHTLVLETFRGPRPEGFHACHNNGNKHDARLLNLRWDTVKNNQADKIKHGTHIQGEDVPTSKLKVYEVIEAKVRIKKGDRNIDIAFNLKVHPDTISDIKTGRSWMHVNI